MPAKILAVKILGDLSGLTSSLETGEGQVNRSVGRIEKKISQMGKVMSSAGKSLTKGLTVPLAGAAAGMFAATVEAGKYADKILDLQQVTGIGTGELQELEYIANQAGVSFEGLTRQIGRSTTRLNEAGHTFDSAVAELQGIEDITERNVRAQELFGQKLDDIAPIIGMTAAEYSGLREAANELGHVQSEEQLKNLD